MIDVLTTDLAMWLCNREVLLCLCGSVSEPLDDHDDNQVEKNQSVLAALTLLRCRITSQHSPTPCSPLGYTFRHPVRLMRERKGARVCVCL